MTIKTGLSVAAYDFVNHPENVDDGTPAVTIDERNLIVTAFDKNGLVVTSVGGTNADGNVPTETTSGATIAVSTASDYVATGTQRDYVVTILPQAVPAGAVDAPIVAKVILTVRQLTTNDPTAVDAKGVLVKTKLSAYTRVITVGAAPATEPSRPNVVSIQRLRPGSQAVVSAFEEASVTGPFDVKIVFTEKPHEFALAKITVDGGTASNLVVGVPFAWHGGTGRY